MPFIPVSLDPCLSVLSETYQRFRLIISTEIRTSFSLLLPLSATECGISEGEALLCVERTVYLFSTCIGKRQNIAFIWRDVGMLLIEGKRVQMKFYEDFLGKLNGTTEALQALLGCQEGLYRIEWRDNLTCLFTFVLELPKCMCSLLSFSKVWDAVSGDELITLAHKHIVKSVDFTQDSNYLLTGGQDKLLRIYDLSKPEAEPDVVSGHTSGIKKALWSSDDKQILSADDKTVRLWDRSTMTEVKALNVAMSVSSMEYVPEGQILVITYGKTIAFHSAETLEQIKSFEAPATINSASLHPEKECLVAGGEDFKLYKYDYNTGEELESYKGHFGPIHCVRFSPDGELYASGSEDGTLRLWQTTVGKTYGLWKCVVPEEENAEAAKARTSLPGTAEEEIEEVASENSDSVYSSTPEVKA
ncbi:serine-threonine kinase receptor-associated protein-like [Excalfactoria chinensis]|uniref:serine-threonine kinase receptor-associated protein-like n=1 Tax=Excalfactoria chinensis TaxID=46218 RepID=UPI003B3BD5D9